LGKTLEERETRREGALVAQRGQRGPAKENHTAEGMANGKVGLQNQ
jgi:hypothetical protein